MPSQAHLARHSSRGLFQSSRLHRPWWGGVWVDRAWRKRGETPDSRGEAALGALGIRRRARTSRSLLGTGGPGCSRVRRWGDSHQETSCREGNLNRRREAGATQRFRRGCVGETRNPVGPTPSIPPPRPAAATRLCWLARRCDGYTGTLGLREPRSVEVGPGPSELSPVGPVSVSAPQCLRTGAFFPQPSGSRAPVIFGYTLETHLGK